MFVAMFAVYGSMDDSDQEEPIDFESIPQVSQRSIIEKFSYDQYAIFDQCSKYSDFLCELYPSMLFAYDIFWDTKFVPETMTFQCIGQPSPWNQGTRNRLVFFNMTNLGTVTDEICDHLIELGLRSKIYFRSGVKVARVHCTPEKFNRMLQACNLEELWIYYPLTTKITDIPMLYNIEELYFDDEPQITNNVLVQLKSKKLRLNNSQITTSGFVFFLKQWIRGERDVVFISVRTVIPIDIEEVANDLGIDLEGDNFRVNRSKGNGIETLAGKRFPSNRVIMQLL